MARLDTGHVLAPLVLGEQQPRARVEPQRAAASCAGAGCGRRPGSRGAPPTAAARSRRPGTSRTPGRRSRGSPWSRSGPRRRCPAPPRGRPREACPCWYGTVRRPGSGAAGRRPGCPRAEPRPRASGRRCHLLTEGRVEQPLDVLRLVAVAAGGERQRNKQQRQEQTAHAGQDSGQIAADRNSPSPFTLENRDEVRHAHICGRLSRRRCWSPGPRPPVRSSSWTEVTPRASTIRPCPRGPRSGLARRRAAGRSPGWPRLRPRALPHRGQGGPGWPSRDPRRAGGAPGARSTAR